MKKSNFCKNCNEPIYSYLDFCEGCDKHLSYSSKVQLIYEELDVEVPEEHKENLK